MITLYTWGTPNGQKISILLEELGVTYQVQPVDRAHGEPFTPAFQVLNPNSKIPALTDSEGQIALFEPGAIMIYLAEKHASFLPAQGGERYQTLQWLMFQMGGLGPLPGAARYAIPSDQAGGTDAAPRNHDEARRQYGVLEQRLRSVEFVAGAYSIADMALYPWVARHQWHRIELAEFEHIERWYRALGQREAVRRGMAVPA